MEQSNANPIGLGLVSSTVTPLQITHKNPPNPILAAKSLQFPHRIGNRGRGTRWWPQTVLKVKICIFQKIQHGGGLPYWKSKTCNKSVQSIATTGAGAIGHGWARAPPLFVSGGHRGHKGGTRYIYFDYNSRLSWSILIIFAPTKIGMNNPQSRQSYVIYLLAWWCHNCDTSQITTVSLHAKINRIELKINFRCKPMKM